MPSQDPHMLSEATSSKLDILAQEGNVLLEDKGDWEGAVAKWQEALSNLPPPQTQFSEALWLFASLGEAYLQGEHLNLAQEAYETAYSCPDGHVNPYILLQLGKIYADVGNEKNALRMLLRAYMIEGRAIFEDDQPYFEYLDKRIDLRA